MEFVVVGVYVIVVGVCGVYACDRVCWLYVAKCWIWLGAYEHALCIMLPNVLKCWLCLCVAKVVIVLIIGVPTFCRDVD